MRATSSGQHDAASLRRVDPKIADLDDIYLDGTLVLVAGHADRQRDPTDPVDVHRAVVEPGEQNPHLAGGGPAWRADSLYTGGLRYLSRITTAKFDAVLLPEEDAR